MAVDLARWQPQVTPQNTRRVVQQARPKGNIEQLGRTITGVANEYDAFQDSLDTARSQSELVRAETEARKKYDSLYRSLEADGEGDYSQFEARLKEGAGKINNEISGQFRTDKARQAWGASLAPKMQTDWTLKTRDLQRRKAVDEVRATVAYKSDDIQSIADDISMPMSRVLEERGKFDTFVSLQAQKGLLDDEQVEAFRQKADTIQTAAMDKRHQQEIELRLNSGQTAAALAYARENYSELDPAKRDDYMQAVEQKAKGLDAINAGDEYWSKSYGNYSLAMAHAHEIKDPEERRAVEFRLNERKAQVEAAKRLTEDKATGELVRHVILDGGSLETASASLLSDASEGTLLTLYNLDKSRKASSGPTSAEQKESSAAGRKFLLGYGMTNSDEFLDGPERWPETRPFLAERFEALMPEDQQDVWMEVQKQRAEGASTGGTTEVFKSLVGQVQFYLPEKDEASKYENVADANPPKDGFTGREEQLRAELFDLAQDYAAENGGKKPNQADSQLMIKQAFARMTKKEGWVPFTKKPIVARYPDAKIEAEIMQIQRADAAGWNAAIEIIGPNASVDQVLEAYKQLSGE